MKSTRLPVLQIEQFDHMHGSYVKREQDFYANKFSTHIRHHHFINTPHKHDFFLVMIFTKGVGVHEIDFKKYRIRPGTVFLMSPGQTHNWKFSPDVEGYIFFHTKEFYEMQLVSERLKDFLFYQSVYENPCIETRGKQTNELKDLFSRIKNEFEINKTRKRQALHSLVRALYINLERIYIPLNEKPNKTKYLGHMKQLEILIEDYYKTDKYPHTYAALMGISEKHLNRISREVLNRTTTELIVGRVLLEAKRLLAQTSMRVYEVANELGYEDTSYFIRLFRKYEKETPTQFIKRYRENTLLGKLH